jgi:hypothetical protein
MTGRRGAPPEPVYRPEDGVSDGQDPGDRRGAGGVPSPWEGVRSLLYLSGGEARESVLAALGENGLGVVQVACDGRYVGKTRRDW